MGKSKRLFLLGVGILGLAAMAYGLAGGFGCRPFRRLEASQITYASVWLTPPDWQFLIEDPTELAGYLREVVIYRQDDSYTEYAGQGVVFTLALADGTQLEVTAYNPFLIIDGVGYRTKYEPCEALNSYGNRLMREGAPVLLPKPPSLAVFSDGNEEGALLGGYSWQSQGPNGSQQTEKEEPVPLLEQKDFLVPLDTTCPTAELHFQEPPDTILEARCWREDAAGISEGQEVITHGFKLQLQNGLWIYEIQAQWEPENGCGGNAVYRFAVNRMV